MTVPQRAYGNTGLSVSLLGLGAGQIGDARLDETQAGQILNGGLDAGVT